jgi:pyruvate,orthophosphate dikinase
LITPQEALRRLDGLDPNALARSHFAEAPVPVGRGIGASAGIAVGRAVFDASSTERLAAGGDPVILLRPDTSTADVAGFAAAAGIVTAVGGRTAHAALVARQMGKPCIVGCGDLIVDSAARRARIGASAIKQGEWLSLDGDDGSVYAGRLEVIVERPDAELAEAERWRAASNPREAVS